MAIIDLIMSGKIKDLKAQVFGQKLAPDSKKTFTASLSESEENALVKMAIYDDKLAWRNFFCKFVEHYPPFNSSVVLLIENLQVTHVADMLAKIGEKWGFAPQILIKLCIAAEGNVDVAPALAAYVKEPHCISLDESVYSALERYDQQSGDIEKFAPKYKSRFETENKEKKSEKKEEADKNATSDKEQ